MQVTIRQLEYFTQLAEAKHFSKAAEACFVSQPALSKQIQLLETSLEVQLFERTTQEVRITEDGEKLLKQAKRIINNLKTLQELAGNTRKKLKIGIGSHVSPEALHSFTTELEKKLEGTLYSFTELSENTIRHSVEEGTFDAVLSTHKDLNSTEKKTVHQENVLLAGSAQAFAEVNKTQEENKTQEVLTLSNEMELGAEIRAVCQKNGLSVKSAHSFESLTQLVSIGSFTKQIIALPSGHAQLLPKSSVKVTLESEPVTTSLYWKNWSAWHLELAELFKT